MQRTYRQYHRKKRIYFIKLDGEPFVKYVDGSLSDSEIWEIEKGYMLDNGFTEDDILRSLTNHRRRKRKNATHTHLLTGLTLHYSKPGSGLITTMCGDVNVTFGFDVNGRSEQQAETIVNMIKDYYIRNMDLPPWYRDMRNAGMKPGSFLVAEAFNRAKNKTVNDVAEFLNVPPKYVTHCKRSLLSKEIIVKVGELDAKGRPHIYDMNVDWKCYCKRKQRTHLKIPLGLPHLVFGIG